MHNPASSNPANNGPHPRMAAAVPQATLPASPTVTVGQPNPPANVAAAVAATLAATNAPQAAPVWARHNNPQVAKVLAAVAKLPGTPQAQATAAMAKYGSAAALCRALGCNGKANQRQVRQVLRDAGMGVGRGNTYSGVVGGKLRKAAQANAKRAAQASKAQAKGNG